MIEMIIKKINISVSIDKKLNDILNSDFINKSKYIENLIKEDFKKNKIVNDK